MCRSTMIKLWCNFRNLYLFIWRWESEWVKYWVDYCWMRTGERSWSRRPDGLLRRLFSQTLLRFSGIQSPATAGKERGRSTAFFFSSKQSTRRSLWAEEKPLCCLLWKGKGFSDFSLCENAHLRKSQRRFSMKIKPHLVDEIQKSIDC